MIPQYFELQVARTPDAVALAYGKQRQSYRELNRRVNQLAHHLRAMGVKQETIVGVYLERSLEMVISLLAVLKAGGAYLPLEPSYPLERVGFMLNDAGVSVLITRDQLLRKLPATELKAVCLDGDRQVIERRASDNPPCAATPTNLAYVIYTSGSTGKPKAAMNHHSGVLNRLLWMQRQYGLSPSDRVLQKTPFSFDVSVWEFFWPLMFGAQLVVARPEGHRDPAYLVETITEERITTVHFVPSMLQVFLEHPRAAECRSLQLIFCSGEALPVDLQNRCMRSLNAQLHNLYGPTECAVDVSHWSCRIGNLVWGVPIGAPVANVQLYVLDETLQPVPIGVFGELYIGGAQVGRGYLNRPDLTAERFIPDPFGNEPGTRLYKTGDRVRWRPDGNLEFHGRLDDQVKIRGVRIELGEIEAVLTEHPRVRESVAVARAYSSGDQRLVAYLVPQGSAPSVGELREYLKAKLPEYMIPSRFVFLERLPLNPNGKVDRRALPALSHVAQAPTHVAPRSESEVTLAGIWAEVLGLERVGIHDNFFELGGHSLLAIKAVSRIRDAFQVDLPLINLFQAPTVAEFVSCLEVLAQGSRAAERAEIKPTTPQPFSHRIDEMSDDAVESLLRSMVGKPGASP